MDDTLNQRTLDYQAYPTPGKISVTPTKTLANQDDLSLAYSPGVAAACMAIFEQGEDAASKYISRANLVGVITNGTAVLGLGNIGPLAAKPVMEGKCCLFKKFSGIDLFDIELAENDPDKLVDIIAALEPTLGGVNLEDIKAPECFYIEKKLRERTKIPLFHDDQHGTAIISSAAILNGLKVVGKDISQVKLACSGTGAAAIACLDLLVSLGAKPENIYAVDSRGVIWDGRDENMEANKRPLCAENRCPLLGGCRQRCRRVFGLFGCGGVNARYGQGHGPKTLDLGFGQPRAGNPAGVGQSRTSRLHYCNGPFGLSESGQ
jgi:malate dehydrogenase (oxaloacetate-decarboxylating)(NADP+)